MRWLNYISEDTQEMSLITEHSIPGVAGDGGGGGGVGVGNC